MNNIGVSNEKKYRFQVPFHEVDHGGVLFFSHLFTHAHLAYEYTMRKLGIGLEHIIRQNTYILPIIHAEAQYHIPLVHGEYYDVEVLVAQIGNSSFTTTYNFYMLNNMLAAQVSLVHCCVRKITNTPCPLPEWMRGPLQQLVNGKAEGKYPPR